MTDLYLYITEYLGPGAFGALADTDEWTGAFWGPGALFFGNRFFVSFQHASKSHFGTLSLPFRLNFGVFFGLFCLFLGIMDFEAPLTRKPYFYRFEGLDYLTFLVFIFEHGFGNTFTTFARFY